MVICFFDLEEEPRLPFFESLDFLRVFCYFIFKFEYHIPAEKGFWGFGAIGFRRWSQHNSRSIARADKVQAFITSMRNIIK